MTILKLNITKISLVLDKNTVDHILLHTELPPTCPNLDKSCMVMRIDVEQDKGLDYIKKNFNNLVHLVKIIKL